MKMKSSIFWDIMLCRLLKVKSRAELCLLPAACFHVGFLACPPPPPPNKYGGDMFL
jgi:hypothetical protein